MESYIFEHIRYIYTKCLHFFQLKATTAVTFGILSFMFDPLEKEGLIALFMLLIADFFMGVAASKKTGIPITSAKVRRTAIKIVIYFGMISSAHITEAAVPAYLHFLDETVLGFLAITELISILENTGKLGYAIPKKLLNQLQKYADKK